MQKPEEQGQILLAQGGMAAEALEPLHGWGQGHQGPQQQGRALLAPLGPLTLVGSLKAAPQHWEMGGTRVAAPLCRCPAAGSATDHCSLTPGHVPPLACV